MLISGVRQRGLNLIEVMVALAILGLALVAVLPSVGDWMQSLAVRNAGESIKAGLEKARQEALRRNLPVTFWLVSDSSAILTNSCTRSAAGASWVVSTMDPGGKCGVGPSQSVDPRIVEKWSSQESAKNVEIKAIADGGGTVDFVTFDSLGQPGANQIAQVDIAHASGAGKTLRIVVSPGGGIRLCDPDVPSSDTRAC